MHDPEVLNLRFYKKEINKNTRCEVYNLSNL